MMLKVTVAVALSLAKNS